MALTSRERVLLALDHRRPDRVPRACPGFGEKIAEHLAPVTPEDHFQVDIRTVRPPVSESEESFTTYLNDLPQDTWLGEHHTLLNYQAWGYRPPLRDGVLEGNPLEQVLPEGIQKISRAARPSTGSLSQLTSEVELLHSRGFAVLAHPPRLGGIMFEAACRVRGFHRFLMDLIENPDLAEYFLQQFTAIACENVRLLVQSGADIVYLSDDLAARTKMLIAPDLWRKMLKPRLANVISTALQTRPDVYILYHSDGNITPVVDDLVEIGVKILHPVQPDAMNPSELRQRYGKRLVLWGAVGSQRLMMHASPEGVRREAYRRAAELGRQGGFILAPAYDLEPAVPFENVEALYSVH